MGSPSKTNCFLQFKFFKHQEEKSTRTTLIKLKKYWFCEWNYFLVVNESWNLGKSLKFTYFSSQTNLNAIFVIYFFLISRCYFSFIYAISELNTHFCKFEGISLINMKGNYVLKTYGDFVCEEKKITSWLTFRKEFEMLKVFKKVHETFWI